MSRVVLKRAGGIAYREVEVSQPVDLPPVLFVHGWPQSSYMWRHMLESLADAGRRAIAPDLPGFGDSPVNPPSTWARHVEAIERFRLDLGFDRVVLVAHDTGGAVGLRWACDHPGAVTGLVVSNTGFFPDLQWTEIAAAMRTPVQGEALIDSLSRDAMATLLAEVASGIGDHAIDEYWKAFSTPAGRRGMLEFYRSFDLDEFGPYEERLGRLGVPALVLWGVRDDYLPTNYATRLTNRIAGAKLVSLQEARHFLFDDEPRRCAEEILDFLQGAGI